MVAFIAFSGKSNTGLPIATLSPTVNVYRLSDFVEVATAVPAAYIDDTVNPSLGGYRVASANTPNVDGEDYYWEADLDPGAVIGLSDSRRYKDGVYSGTINARIETDIPLIVADIDEPTRPFLGVAFDDITDTLALAVHATRNGARVVPTSLTLTWRNPDGTTLFSLTEVSAGVTLEGDDAYRWSGVQALTTGFVYRVEVTVTDATGTIGPRMLTVAKQ